MATDIRLKEALPEITEAVVMGTSLGANVTLEVASQAPERVRGMVVEMPATSSGSQSGKFTLNRMPLAKPCASSLRMMSGPWRSAQCQRGFLLSLPEP